MTTSTTITAFNVIDVAFSDAIRILDKQYGEGYAKKNPQLIASMTQIILDVSKNECVASDPYQEPKVAPDNLRKLFLAYEDYENKILTQKELLYKLRDYYYNSLFGLDYEDWLEVI